MSGLFIRVNSSLNVIVDSDIYFKDCLQDGYEEGGPRGQLSTAGLIGSLLPAYLLQLGCSFEGTLKSTLSPSILRILRPGSNYRTDKQNLSYFLAINLSIRLLICFKCLLVYFSTVIYRKTFSHPSPSFFFPRQERTIITHNFILLKSRFVE